MKSKNLKSYSEFILENNKNGYQVYVNEKPVSDFIADYKKAKSEYEDILFSSKEGSLVQLKKADGTIKKEEKVEKNKIEFDSKEEFDVCLSDALLDLFAKVKNLETDELELGKEISVKFRINAKDFRFMATGIELDENLKTYEPGIDIKKPYILKVKSIKNKYDVDIDDESYEKLKNIKPKDLTPNEKKTLELFSEASNFIKDNRGDEPFVFDVNFIVVFEENPNFGKNRKEVMKDNESDDDNKYTSYSIKKLRTMLKSNDIDDSIKDDILDELERRGEDPEGLDF